MFKLKFIIEIILFVTIISTLVIIGHLVTDKPFKWFGSNVSVVASGSMRDELKEGDFIFYKEAANYQVDDIIVFSYSGIIIVHRIIEVTDEGFITKGDNNVNNDFQRYGYIKDSQIIGKVHKKRSLLGLGKLIIKIKG